MDDNVYKGILIITKLQIKQDDSIIIPYYQYILHFGSEILKIFQQLLNNLQSCRNCYMFPIAQSIFYPNMPTYQIFQPYSEGFLQIEQPNQLYFQQNTVNFLPCAFSFLTQFQQQSQGLGYIVTGFKNNNILQEDFNSKQKSIVEKQNDNLVFNSIQSSKSNKPFNKSDDRQIYFCSLQNSHLYPKRKKLPIKKKPETKNLIKNYGRSILTFILKNTQRRQKVLAYLQIDETNFIEAVYSFRDHIHTISAIRYLWQNHPYSKAFRILSCEYLRKHNLQHIFNSRVYKHNVYLKYQRKLMKSIQNPKDFQSIKQL